MKHGGRGSGKEGRRGGRECWSGWVETRGALGERNRGSIRDGRGKRIGRSAGRSSGLISGMIIIPSGRRIGMRRIISLIDGADVCRDRIDSNTFG